jgi:hypothetical protein
VAGVELTAAGALVALIIGLVCSGIGGAIGGIAIGGKSLGNELAAMMGSFYGPIAGVPGLVAGGKYAAAFAALAQLRPAVDTFFDEVMVMDPDPALRANRLAMLGTLRELFTGIADLSRLPG